MSRTSSQRATDLSESRGTEARSDASAFETERTLTPALSSRSSRSPVTASTFTSTSVRSADETATPVLSLGTARSAALRARRRSVTASRLSSLRSAGVRERLIFCSAAICSAALALSAGCAAVALPVAHTSAQVAAPAATVQLPRTTTPSIADERQAIHRGRLAATNLNSAHHEPVTGA